MQQNLIDIKLTLSELASYIDIEDIVFNYDGQPQFKSRGKIIIDNYNNTARYENDHLKYTPRKEIFDVSDTKHFSITWCSHEMNNHDRVSITTYYFKEIIIIETTRNVQHSSNTPKYQGFRHNFTPYTLLFLKHFHQSNKTQEGLEYIKRNPHYFKYCNLDTVALIKKAHDTVDEIIQQHKNNTDSIELLTRNNLELELENKILKNKIAEMELDKSSFETFIKLKIE